MVNATSHVLVAPLEWGLGHATRCIPIIRELISQQIKVTICATGACKILLKNEFPDLNMIEIPGIIVHYPENGRMALSMLTQTPALLKAISKEHEELELAIQKHQFTHVISDNRYGFYSHKVKTAFITHQIKIKGGRGLKFMEPVLFKINKKYIERYNELWIPDLSRNPRLSGDLSDNSGIKIPSSNIGVLSRFREKIKEPSGKYDIIALLSGPEPQRSVFETKVRSYFSTLHKKCLIIQGLPGKIEKEKQGLLEIIPSISSGELTGILHPETLLIARPGYSTIMDLAVLGHRKTLFVPTPGQTEQEYLAEYLFHTFGYCYIRQNEKFPEENIKEGEALPQEIEENLLKTVIKKFLTR